MTDSMSRAAAPQAAPPDGGNDTGGASSGVDPARLARIRWRCRRGLLENDIVLARYLDARGGQLDEGEIGQLDRLLELPDNELWDLVAGRAAPRDAALQPLVAALREA